MGNNNTLNLNRKTRNIDIVAAKSGNPTLLVDGVLLHSKYDPIKEAKTFLDANNHIYNGEKNVVIYGLGLGYHLDELLNRVSSECSIYVFDVDEDVIQIGTNLGLTQKILNDHRVKAYLGYSNYVLKEFGDALKKVEDILLYKPSLRVLPEYYKDFKNAMNNYSLGKIGIERFGSQLEENSLLNSRVESQEICEFINDYSVINQPVVLISAGPSLDTAIDDLKKIRNNVKLFCVGSALRTLMKNGISPDMICIIDAQPIVYEQIRNYEDLDIPLCFLSTASHLAVSRYYGPKYVFYNQKTEHEEGIIINTGRSVSTALLDIAIKSRANPIIFVGQDLAFIDNKHHTETYFEMYGASNTVDDHGIYKKVVGVDGMLHDTTLGLLSFKGWIERAIRENPQTKFINCSKGLRIDGTIEMNLGEFKF